MTSSSIVLFFPLLFLDSSSIFSIIFDNSTNFLPKATKYGITEFFSELLPSNSNSFKLIYQ
jgi:hypothetical protein